MNRNVERRLPTLATGTDETAKLNFLEGDTMYKTYCSAIAEVVKTAESTGYTLSDDNVFDETSIGGKPSVGMTKRISLELYKNGRLQQKMLQAQVYQFESGKFELNQYIF